MTEAGLERLIAAWYRRPGAEDDKLLGPSPNCPPLTRLWRHVAAGQPLEEYQDHVGRCDRCRRVCEIIEQEHARAAGAAAVAPSVPGAGDGISARKEAGIRISPPPSERVGRPTGLGPRRTRYKLRPVHAAGALVAAAACIALVFVSWPRAPFEPEVVTRAQPSFEPEVGAFMTRACDITPFPVRGEPAEPPAAEAPPPPGWITAVLHDPGVEGALATHDVTETEILYHLGQALLRIDSDGLPAPAEGIDEATVERCGLRKLLARDRAACETIVEALVRHVPGAREEDRARLAQALDRWRAENVFTEHRSAD